jgi:hypothetical protein
MSIASEITRIQGLKADLRTKLVSMALVAATADLQDCVEAVEGITDNGAVSATLTVASTSYDVPEGYHDGSGTVGIVLEEKSVSPGASSQQITPSTGKVLSKVTVAAIPGNLADVSNVTAAAGDVLATKIFVTAAGAEVAGTMPNNGAVSGSINGMVTDTYTVPAGYHNGSGSVTLTGDIETALAAI